MVATADVFTVTKVEDGADYVGADYYGNNFAAHNRDAYSTVNVTDKNGNSLFNIENAIVTKGDETPTYYVATGAGLKTAITSGADYVKLMDDVVGSGEERRRRGRRDLPQPCGRGGGQPRRKLRHEPRKRIEQRTGDFPHLFHTKFHIRKDNLFYAKR